MNPRGKLDLASYKYIIIIKMRIVSYMYLLVLPVQVGQLYLETVSSAQSHHWQSLQNTHNLKVDNIAGMG